MATTRIKDLSESLALQSDMYIAADNEDGTKKVLAANLVDDTLTESGKFADAAAVGDALNEKVPKETGKGLSTEDFTTAEKTKLSGIESGATNTVIDDTLTEEGQAADAKATGDEIADLKEDLDLKADPDGTYPDMTVGTAQQLETDQYTEDSEPYHFRKSGGDNVRVGEREIDKIVGGTLAWNQLAKNGNFADGTTNWNTEGSVSTSNNEITMVWTPIYSQNGLRCNYDIGYVIGHKYLVTATVKNNGANQRAIHVGQPYGERAIKTVDANAKTVVSSVLNITINTGNGYEIIAVGGNSLNVEYNLTVSNVMLIDLTAAFDSTIADYIYSLEQSTAGAGVAWVRKYIDIDTYHPYDAGTLKSVEGLVSHDMVGFNQWDEEAEVGSINSSTGENSPTVTQIRSKNYIPCFSGCRYCFTSPMTGNDVRIAFYRADKSYISMTAWAHNGEFTTPEHSAYMRFYTAISYGTTYNHDICINLSDPAKNGTYEPYEHHSYPLDSTVILRGVPQLVDGKLQYDGDRYASDGTVTRRYGIVDLGTLTWEKNASYSGLFNTQLVGRKIEVDIPFMCSGYTRTDSATVITLNNTIAFSNGGYLVYVHDDSYADAASFKAAVTGMMLVYELATPTTEEAAPFTSPQWVDGSGTEQYVSTSLVPIGHYTQYPEDLKEKLEGLPWNFASLIAPTEAAYKATQAYSTGALFIVNNILYKATTSIASGATITPNTNCTQTTLAAVIAAL